MGTFNLLDGRKVKVYYRGNQNTCGWCHKNSAMCPGDGRAKACRESGTQQVFLGNHMQTLWTEINFSPEAFEAPEVDYDAVDDVGNLGGDRKVLTATHFPRNLNRPKIVEADKNKFSVARINNFPLEATEDMIINFLKKEVDESIVAENLKTEKTNHSINVYLGPEPSLEVVARAIEVLDYNSTKKTFFEERKLHAQLYRPLTPEKVKPLGNLDDEDQKVNTT